MRHFGFNDSSTAANNSVGLVATYNYDHFYYFAGSASGSFDNDSVGFEWLQLKADTNPRDFYSHSALVDAIRADPTASRKLLGNWTATPRLSFQSRVPWHFPSGTTINGEEPGGGGSDSFQAMPVKVFPTTGEFHRETFAGEVEDTFIDSGFDIPATEEKEYRFTVGRASIADDTRPSFRIFASDLRALTSASLYDDPNDDRSTYIALILPELATSNTAELLYLGIDSSNNMLIANANDNDVDIRIEEIRYTATAGGGSTDIADESITTEKLADDAVTADKIADGVLPSLNWIPSGTITKSASADPGARSANFSVDLPAGKRLSDYTSIQFKHDTLAYPTSAPNPVINLGDYNDLIFTETAELASIVKAAAPFNYVVISGQGRGANNLAIKVLESVGTATSISVRITDLNISGRADFRFVNLSNVWFR